MGLLSTCCHLTIYIYPAAIVSTIERKGKEKAAAAGELHGLVSTLTYQLQFPPGQRWWEGANTTLHWAELYLDTSST